MSTQDIANPAGHRRSKSSGDAAPSSMAAFGHSRSRSASDSFPPLVFGLGLGFGVRAANPEHGSSGPAHGAPGTSTATVPFLGAITEESGEEVVLSNAPQLPASAAATGEDHASEEVVVAAEPGPSETLTAVEGTGNTAAVPTDRNVRSTAPAREAAARELEVERTGLESRAALSQASVPVLAGQSAPGQFGVGPHAGFQRPSRTSAAEQASAFGTVVPGPSRRATVVSTPAGNLRGPADVRRPRVAGSYVALLDHHQSEDHHEEREGAHPGYPNPQIPLGMSQEAYERACDLNARVYREEEAANSEFERARVPRVDQHGNLVLPRDLSRAEFEAEQHQLLADAAAFSERVRAEEAQRGGTGERDGVANGRRNPQVPHGLPEDMYESMCAFSERSRQEVQAEEAHRRRNVPAVDRSGNLVLPRGLSRAEVEAEQAAIMQRGFAFAERVREEIAAGGESGERAGSDIENRNPLIPFGMHEDRYEWACAMNEQVRREESERERLEGQAGPSSEADDASSSTYSEPTRAEMEAQRPRILEWQKAMAQQPAESDLTLSEFEREQHRARALACLEDPFVDRDSSLALSWGPSYRTGQAGLAGFSSTIAVRASHNRPVGSNGSPHARGTVVATAVGDFLALGEQTLPSGPQARRSPSMYSQASGYGTRPALATTDIVGASAPEPVGSLGSPICVQGRNPSSTSEVRVNSGTGEAEESSGNGNQREGEGEMVVERSANLPAPALSNGAEGDDGPSWVYESPLAADLQGSGSRKDKGKGKATGSVVPEKVANELPSGAPAAPAAFKGEGPEMGPRWSFSWSVDTHVHCCPWEDPSALQPPSQPPQAEVSTADEFGVSTEEALEFFESYNAGIEPPKTTRQKVKGGLKELARGFKGALKTSNNKETSAATRAFSAPAPAPRSEIDDETVEEGAMTVGSGGSTPRFLASLTGRFTPRPGTSASFHSSTSTLRVSITSSSETCWPVRQSSLPPHSPHPNLRSPSQTATTLNKPLPRTPTVAVNVPFTGAVPHSTLAQLRNQELEAALQRANTERQAAESRAGDAEQRLARSLADTERLATQVADLQDRLAAQQIDSQQRYDSLERGFGEELEDLEDRHAAEFERMRSHNLEVVRVLEGSHRNGRRELEVVISQLHVANGGLQAHLQIQHQLQLQQQQMATAYQTQQRGPAANEPVIPAPAQQRGTAANEPFPPFADAAPPPYPHPGFFYPPPPQHPPQPQPRVGIFGPARPSPPPPPPQPSFAPPESTRRRNREVRIAQEELGPQFRRIQRGWESNSD